jgi:ribose/xylose/arabinose/galactoside ABC-type transport system permease subunit/ABC-type sugar transport system substrate-binding protein
MKTFKQILPVFIALIVICIVMSVLSSNFLSVDNIRNVLMQASINAVIAAGMTFVIITAGIDLSVGSVVAFAGMILGFSLHSGMPWYLAVLTGIGAGGICGLLNGLLITRGKLPPFIVTLGMMSIARGFALILNNGRPVSGFDDSFRFIAEGSILGIPVLIWITLIVYIAGYLILQKTPFGRYVYAIGGNIKAAKLSGINTNKVLVIVYIISGLMAGLASVMLTSRINSSQPTAGLMYELDAIAATVIGGTSLMGGYGFISGTIIGALIISIIRNGLNLMNVSSFLQQVVIGCVIIFAVLIDSIRNSRSGFDLGRLFKKYSVAVVFICVIIIGGITYFGIKSNKNSDMPKIAFIMKTLNNPFFISMSDGARKEIAGHPEYKLIVQAPERETDVERQMQMVENAITEKVAAICITPSAEKEILPALLKADEAKIPLILVDSNIDEKLAKDMNVTYNTFIGSDNYNGGVLAARYIAKKLDGRGNVAVIEGMPGAQTNEQRKGGFLDTIKQYPGMKVAAVQPADYERGKGYDVAQNILQANRDLNAIFACSDLMALGAVEAVKQAGKEGRILIIGFDALDDAKKEIMNGSMTGTIAQFPGLMGRQAIESAMKIINGEKVPHRQSTRIELITKDVLEKEGYKPEQ